MSLTRSSAVKDRASSSAKSYQGSDKLVFGIVLAVVTFWLFAQTTLNIASTMRADLRISESLNNISVSITALFSGIFIVVAGKSGRPSRSCENDLCLVWRLAFWGHC